MVKIPRSNNPRYFINTNDFTNERELTRRFTTTYDIFSGE
jgi:hypothetical protein